MVKRLLAQAGAAILNEETDMFDKDRFIEDCRAALKDSDARGAVKELVARAVREPAQIVRALGEPVRSGVETVYRGPDMTILNLYWGPRMNIFPHDHRMWAVIGIYGGCESNTFFRRRERDLTSHGTKMLEAKDTIVLGESIIHAVTNPLDQITSAIHVYGGDFFAMPRSEWDAQTFEEHPYDVAHTMRAFEEANTRLAAMQGSRVSTA
jgi:predicted metal-dependent enzyme (double-stranded beta helix superfamily)